MPQTSLLDARDFKVYSIPCSRFHNLKTIRDNISRWLGGSGLKQEGEGDMRCFCWSRDPSRRRTSFSGDSFETLECRQRNSCFFGLGLGSWAPSVKKGASNSIRQAPSALLVFGNAFSLGPSA